MISFTDLLPERICDVISQQGWEPTGQIFQLNSYENRVYQIHLENKEQIVAKFYRPGRWNQQSLINEHQVLQALAQAEVPVVPALPLKHFSGLETLGFEKPYYYCLYPKFGGHEQPELNSEHREWLGRLLARLHNITSALNIQHRMPLNTKTYGDGPLATILSGSYAPAELKNYLEDMMMQCLDLIDPLLHQNWNTFAVHGDCHLGNVLWNAKGPTLVDFDDMVMAPAIQDIWMLFYGSEAEQTQQKKDFFAGYELFRPFDHHEFILVEPLRTLRMIRYCAWIGERYQEAIFQQTFPYYTEIKYWEDFLQSMKEQVAVLQNLTQDFFP